MASAIISLVTMQMHPWRLSPQLQIYRREGEENLHDTIRTNFNENQADCSQLANRKHPLSGHWITLKLGLCNQNSENWKIRKLWSAQLKVREVNIAANIDSERNSTHVRTGFSCALHFNSQSVRFLARKRPFWVQTEHRQTRVLMWWNWLIVREDKKWKLFSVRIFIKRGPLMSAL